MRPCIICGSENAVPLYVGLVRCPACSFVYYPRLPSPDEIARLYGESYFCGDEYADYVRDKAVLQKNFRLRLRTLERFAGARRNLLEIGSAYGFFLDVARQPRLHARLHGQGFDVHGIDITEAGCRHAREDLKLHVTCGDFLSLDLPAAHYEIVCLWDTLEHLARPDAYVEKIARSMCRDGLLCITTGDIASALARLRGQRWRLIHPPTHLYYFSLATLRRLLANHGFEIIYARHQGSYRSLEQILYGLLWVNKGTFRRHLYAIMRTLPLVRTPIYLNLHDILFVIAQRRSP